MGQAMIKVQSLCCSQNNNSKPQQNNQQFNPKLQGNENQTQEENQLDVSIQNSEQILNDSKEHTDRSFMDSEKKNKSDLSQFLKIKQIGQGAFGKVYTVKRNDPNSQTIYAMKVIKKQDIKKYGLMGYIKVEKDVLCNNKHPFIVNLKQSFQTVGKVYLVMEFIQGGALYPYLKQIQRTQREKVAQFIMAQTILGIEALHQEHNVIYRDLKPENILVTLDGNIKLTDFGLSKVFNPQDEFEKFKGMGGTQEYFAPEVVQNLPWDKNVDIWCLGIFLYELIAGQCPFVPDKRGGMTPYFKKKITTVDIQYPSFFSQNAIDLIQKLLKKEPQERLGANDFNDLKSHKFFKGIDWKLLSELKMESPLKKYVQQQQQQQNKNQVIQKLPPRPILETYIKDPQLQIQGISYRPDLTD